MGTAILVVLIAAVVGAVLLTLKMRKEANKVEKRAQEQAKIVQSKLDARKTQDYRPSPDAYAVYNKPIQKPVRKPVERKTEESSYVAGESLADYEVVTGSTEDFWGYNDSSSNNSSDSYNYDPSPSTSYDPSPSPSSYDPGPSSSYDSGSPTSYDSGSSSPNDY